MTRGRRIYHSQARKLNTRVKREMGKINHEIMNPPDRHVALMEIERIMGKTYEFHKWFDEIYKLKSTDFERYEAEIFKKLADLQADEAYNALDELLGPEGGTQKEMESVVELFQGREKRYKDKHVPGHTCPKCGIALTVNEREMKTTDPDRPRIERRLVCPNYFVNGCTHKEKWTPEIKAILEAEAVRIGKEVQVEF